MATVCEIRAARNQAIKDAKANKVANDSEIRTARDNAINQAKTIASNLIREANAKKKASKSKENIKTHLDEIRASRDASIATLKKEANEKIIANRVALAMAIDNLKSSAQEEINKLSSKKSQNPKKSQKTKKPKKSQKEDIDSNTSTKPIFSNNKNFEVSLQKWGSQLTLLQVITDLTKFVKCESVTKARAIISRNKDESSISRAYKQLALLFHSDRVNCRDDLTDDEKIKCIQIMKLLTSKRI